MQSHQSSARIHDSEKSENHVTFIRLPQTLYLPCASTYTHRITLNLVWCNLALEGLEWHLSNMFLKILWHCSGSLVYFPDFYIDAFILFRQHSRQTDPPDETDTSLSCALPFLQDETIVNRTSCSSYCVAQCKKVITVFVICRMYNLIKVFVHIIQFYSNAVQLDIVFFP